MADFLDDLINIKKELSTLSDEVNAEADKLQGKSATTPTGPVWSPGDYKVVPKGNMGLCTRYRYPNASCDMCVQVCPCDAIRFDEGDDEINIDEKACRKCGLCAAACPTEAISSPLHNPKAMYDMVCGAAEEYDMAYVTCTRALGHVPPEKNIIVTPCVGVINAEVWYSILTEYGNVAIYLPRDVCAKCRTTTGDDFLTEQISVGESWANETVDLIMREKDFILTTDHEKERKTFVSSSMKSLGMTAATINPLTNKVAKVAEKLMGHAGDLNKLQGILNNITGATSTAQRPRVLTSARQLMLLALSNHPDTAENILLDMPVILDSCDGCENCAELCPTSAIDVVDGKAQVVSTHCVACGLCFDACPVGAIDFEEVDGHRLIVDDPEAKKKIEEKERAERDRELARERGKEYGKKALDFLEKQADIEERELLGGAPSSKTKK